MPLPIILGLINYYLQELAIFWQKMKISSGVYERFFFCLNLLKLDIELRRERYTAN